MSKTKHPQSYLSITGGRVHNLQNVDVKLPHNKMIVVVGVSGSGKSSLVFDLIYSEARRRYMETLDNNYVRNFIQHLERSDVDAISGLQAPIGIAQETKTSTNLRSTIGTLTDIYAYLRLLYARASDAYSHITGEKMVERSTEQIEEQIMTQFAGQEIMLLAPIVQGRKGHYQDLFARLLKKGFYQVRINKVLTPLVPNMYVDRYKTHDIELVVEKGIKVDSAYRYELTRGIGLALHYGQGTLMIKDTQGQYTYFSRSLMDPRTGLAYQDPSPNTFSFNSKYGACATCKGFGKVIKQSIAPFVATSSLTIQSGGIVPLGPYKKNVFFNQLSEFLEKKGYSLTTPICDIAEEVMMEVIYGAKKKYEKPFISVIKYLERRWTKQQMADLIAEQYQTCPSCNGARLHQEALHFKIAGKHISALCQLNLADLYDWCVKLPQHLTKKQLKIGNDLLKSITRRLSVLLEMGLSYLSLDRPLQTLSSGEIRRIRLATQIGTQDRYLVGVMYILDEPSIGLHQRDNVRLLTALKSLRDMGNTIIVIEHDKETMLVADHLLEIGPGPGIHGGKIVAQGAPKAFLREKSVTADFLLGQKYIPLPDRDRKGGSKEFLRLKGCRGHNLKNVNLEIPLGKFVVVTGVSGSGKSTLINQTLLPVLKQRIAKVPIIPLPYQEVSGVEHIDKVIEIDQTPIGRTLRSTPSTYTGVFTPIRELFAMLPQAKLRGFGVGRFSFNVNGGTCTACKGAGIQLVEMDFLPSIRVTCDVCRGRRYNRETLQVKYKGKSIADVLDMTINHALAFFEGHPRIITSLQTLEKVGLGYVQLGQYAPSLSGGEAQRMKLSTELQKRSTGKTLYLLDEPTTGLHFQDVAKLLKILQQLVEKGNTVIIIEHNMDVIKVADHIIDLGPEAGDKGGQIIASGPPKAIVKVKESHTGHFLAEELALTRRKTK